MPGMATWKQLYRTEFETLYEEGYPVGDKAVPDMSESYIPEATHVSEGDADDDGPRWEQAYRNLWQVREKGLRPDYPYQEPNDLETILARAPSVPSLVPLSPDSYRERAAGAWLGRCAGVTLGKPVEMELMDGIREYLKSVDAWPLQGYVPPRSEKLDRTLKCHDSTLGNIAYVPVDDDVSYTVAALLLVEQHGRDFGKVDVARSWLHLLPYSSLYSCTKMAYYNMVSHGMSRPMEDLVEDLPLMHNPMREGLNASIRVDLFGFISPADPRGAAEMTYRNASVNSTKNGIYAAMFVTGCIAGALSENPTVDTILDCGLSCVPTTSRLYEAIQQTREWYAVDKGWEPVCRRIYERWGHLNWAGAMYNFPITALALLHGNLDFSRSITTAVMCGVDTDCTAGTVGGIVGAAVGQQGIPQPWYDVFNDRVRTFVAGNGHGDGTLTNLIDRTTLLMSGTHA